MRTLEHKKKSNRIAVIRTHNQSKFQARQQTKLASTYISSDSPPLFRRPLVSRRGGTYSNSLI